jgi:aminocarboxymuconate-semialdehyde decarboxylase
MTIDTHAHALDEAFLQGLCRTPRFGLSADRDRAGRFCVRRGDGAAVSLDDELSNIPRRIESLSRRDVGLQLIGPPPGFASWPGGAADVAFDAQGECRTYLESGPHCCEQSRDG